MKLITSFVLILAGILGMLSESEDLGVLVFVKIISLLLMYGGIIMFKQTKFYSKIK